MKSPPSWINSTDRTDIHFPEGRESPIITIESSLEMLVYLKSDLRGCTVKALIDTAVDVAGGDADTLRRMQENNINPDLEDLRESIKNKKAADKLAGATKKRVADDSTEEAPTKKTKLYYDEGGVVDSGMQMQMFQFPPGMTTEQTIGILSQMDSISSKNMKEKEHMVKAKELENENTKKQLLLQDKKHKTATLKRDSDIAKGTRKEIHDYNMKLLEAKTNKEENTDKEKEEMKKARLEAKTRQFEAVEEAKKAAEEAKKAAEEAKTAAAVVEAEMIRKEKEKINADALVEVERIRAEGIKEAERIRMEAMAKEGDEDRKIEREKMQLERDKLALKNAQKSAKTSAKKEKPPRHVLDCFTDKDREPGVWAEIGQPESKINQKKWKTADNVAVGNGQSNQTNEIDAFMKLEYYNIHHTRPPFNWTGSLSRYPETEMDGLYYLACILMKKKAETAATAAAMGGV